MNILFSSENALTSTKTLLTLNECRNEVQKLLTKASDDEALGIAILVTVVIVSPVIIVLLRNAVATIQVCKSSCCNLIMINCLN